jgi:hypothetical protein
LWQKTTSETLVVTVGQARACWAWHEQATVQPLNNSLEPGIETELDPFFSQLLPLVGLVTNLHPHANIANPPGTPIALGMAPSSYQS